MLVSYCPPFFTCGNLFGPSTQRGLRRGDALESNRLKRHGVPLCALDERDPGAVVILTFGPFPVPARNNAGTVC